MKTLFKQSEIGKLKVHSVNYQRNGVAGIGFYVVRFDFRDGRKVRRMIGHVYPTEEAREEGRCPPYYGVVDIDNPEECWRGDNFADAMWAACLEYEARRDADLHTA